MLSEKRFLQIAVTVCCIVLTLGSIVSCGYTLFFFKKNNDWRDIRLELAFFTGSIILAAFWLIALFKDSCRFFLIIFLISMLPFVHAVVGFISVIYDRIYVYKEIFINVGVDEDDIPFYSLLLAFIRIVLWCIPTVTFHRLWTLEKSSPVPPKSDKESLLTPV